MSNLPGVDRMNAAFAAANRSIFRLETLQVYGNSGEDADFATFCQGDTLPLDTDGWYVSMVRAQTLSGVSWQRVHVVREPLSEYLQFELVTYADNVAAGEDVRIIDATDLWPPGIPQGMDFWLFDENERFDLCYDADGIWFGATRTSHQSAVREACDIQDAALAHTESWRDYMRRRHPDLWQRVPDAALAGL